MVSANCFKRKAQAVGRAYGVVLGSGCFYRGVQRPTVQWLREDRVMPEWVGSALCLFSLGCQTTSRTLAWLGVSEEGVSLMILVLRLL